MFDYENIAHIVFRKGEKDMEKILGKVLPILGGAALGIWSWIGYAKLVEPPSDMTRGLLVIGAIVLTTGTSLIVQLVKK